MQNVPATMAQVMRMLHGKAVMLTILLSGMDMIWKACMHCRAGSVRELKHLQSLPQSSPVVQVCHARRHIMGSEKELKHLQAAVGLEPTFDCSILPTQQASVAVERLRGPSGITAPEFHEYLKTCTSMSHCAATHMQRALAAKLQQKPCFNIADALLNCSGSMACLQPFRKCQKLSRPATCHQHPVEYRADMKMQLAVISSAITVELEYDGHCLEG